MPPTVAHIRALRQQGDLKKEIKKLQRLRDQVKTWLQVTNSTHCRCKSIPSLMGALSSPCTAVERYQGQDKSDAGTQRRGKPNGTIQSMRKGNKDQGLLKTGAGCSGEGCAD